MIDDALLRVLSAHTGRPQAFAQPPTPMTGGFWAAIYGFELDQPPAELRGPLVLRVMPSPDAALVETIVQRVVAEQGYPTPRVLLGASDDALGGAFMVMERVDGDALLAGLGIGRALFGLPKTLRWLARQLSIASVQLHDLDPQPIIESLELAGVDRAALGTEARLGEIRGAAEASVAGFDELLAWLQSRRPDLTPAVVCHGDIHPFNMLTTADDSFILLDWTNANLCRREFDVGFTAALLQCAPMAVPSIFRRPVGAITGSLARRFIDTYRRMAPINLDVVEWFEVLQYGRCLAAVATTPVDDRIVGKAHPFRMAAPAMIRQVRVITGVTVDLSTPS
jgi:aminoglycoside phosphotransferase (APT) family kinase protein